MFFDFKEKDKKYCPICGDTVELQLMSKASKIKIGNEEFDADVDVYKCKHCGYEKVSTSTITVYEDNNPALKKTSAERLRDKEQKKAQEQMERLQAEAAGLPSMDELQDIDPESFNTDAKKPETPTETQTIENEKAEQEKNTETEENTEDSESPAMSDEKQDGENAQTANADNAEPESGSKIVGVLQKGKNETSGIAYSIYKRLSKKEREKNEVQEYLNTHKPSLKIIQDDVLYDTETATMFLVIDKMIGYKEKHPIKVYYYVTQTGRFFSVLVQRGEEDQFDIIEEKHLKRILAKRPDLYKKYISEPYTE